MILYRVSWLSTRAVHDLPVAWPACVWIVGGNQITWSQPTEAQGEHANTEPRRCVQNESQIGSESL